MLHGRPCELSREIGAVAFAMSADADGTLPSASVLSTKAALRAAASWSDESIPMRGERGVFLMWVEGVPGRFTVSALAREKMALTLRVEDAWRAVGGAVRMDGTTPAYSVRILRDGVAAGQPGEDEVSLEGVYPDARIFVDIAPGGGFVMEFTGEDK